MKRFKRKLIIKQIYYNGEKDDICEIKFAIDESGNVNITEMNEIEARNAACHLMARLTIDELIGFIKITNFTRTSVLRGMDKEDRDLEDIVFEIIADQWNKICFNKSDIFDMFELVFEKDQDVEIEDLGKKEEISKEDAILEGIKTISKQLEKIFEFLVTQQIGKKY